jgi:hypothetical protein
MNKGEIILYQPNTSVQLEVRMEADTVWLNRQQISVLFDRDIKTIGKHINNALSEELKGIPTVAKFATVQQEGNRMVTRNVEYYNLDVIVSVGYRVKSQRGIEFRQWANSVLKDYLLKGYSINHRMTQIENKIEKHNKIIEEHDKKIDFFIRSSLPPIEGIFFDGQIFDAYNFINNLIRSAKNKIILFDNYVDDTVLAMLDKRNNDVNAIIYTKTISKQLSLDIEKHNSQYREIQIKETSKIHDRFLCIDNVVYHIGASLKDLGKKWFAFSKMEIQAELLLGNIKDHF